MAASMPSQILRRVTQASAKPCCRQQQIRHASLLRRPIRPYTFTQLISLSDGSTFLSRTTSPQPIFRSTKDSRNSPLWQPSDSSLRNVEQDEAGRLRAFRNRFGRGWDLDSETEAESDAKDEAKADEDGKMSGKAVGGKNEASIGSRDSLMDLISGRYDATEISVEEEQEKKVVGKTVALPKVTKVNGKVILGERPPKPTAAPTESSPKKK